MIIYFHKKIQILFLIFNKAFIVILATYFSYNIIFLTKNIVKLLKYIRIDNDTIKPEKNNQLLFGPIYSLQLIKLKTLKIYIKINLANGFI